MLKKHIEIIKIREDLELPQTLDDDEHYRVENVWIECKIENIQNNLIIGSVYRHPKGNVKKFSTLFEDRIKKVDGENKNCIICGDININALAVNHNDSKNFYNIILSENVIPHIKIPKKYLKNT